MFVVLTTEANHSTICMSEVLFTAVAWYNVPNMPKRVVNKYETSQTRLWMLHIAKFLGGGSINGDSRLVGE